MAINVIDVDFVARCNRPEARYCVREEFEDKIAGGSVGMFALKKWTYHYNDGTKETVTLRYRRK